MSDPKHPLYCVPGNVRVDPSCRRIGHRHAVVTLPTVARVVDKNELVLELEGVERNMQNLQGQLKEMAKTRARLQKMVDDFDKLPIERVDLDPEVPQHDQSIELPDNPEPAGG